MSPAQGDPHRPPTVSEPPKKIQIASEYGKRGWTPSPRSTSTPPESPSAAPREAYAAPSHETPKAMSDFRPEAPPEDPERSTHPPPMTPPRPATSSHAPATTPLGDDGPAPNSTPTAASPDAATRSGTRPDIPNSNEKTPLVRCLRQDPHPQRPHERWKKPSLESCDTILRILWCSRGARDLLLKFLCIKEDTRRTRFASKLSAIA